MRKRKIYLKDIIREHADKSYAEIYELIRGKMEEGILMPVQKAGLNGCTPALPVAFWQCEEEREDTDILEEMKFRLHPILSREYYRLHPEQYYEDRKFILLLSDYLTHFSFMLKVPETINERSFEIFRREKFFREEGGLKLCKRLGVTEKVLNIYDTSEPLAYYSDSKQKSQNILIIENKDTFYDMRSYLQQTGSCILGTKFDTLIYGAGKGIWRTFSDYANGAELYFNSKNPLFYFGDIDYEGILIYEKLVSKQWKDVDDRDIVITPYLRAYEAALDKADKIGIEGLPDSKEKQNTNISTIFLDFFEEKRKEQMLAVLQAGKYIPQEILNEQDW